MKQDSLPALRSKINAFYLTDETETVHRLLDFLQDYDTEKIRKSAHKLVETVRKGNSQQTITEAFLNEYQLNSKEGIVLMGIAEALLRIPDAPTQDLFLREKLSGADWREHLEHSDSILVNLSTRALLLSGGIENRLSQRDNNWFQLFDELSSRLGVPLIRTALKQSMQQLAYRFVIAESIEQAMQQGEQHPAYRYSFDMLGEAALTATDAECYYGTYYAAIDALAKHALTDDLYTNPGISIKLSALCPRYEPLQHSRATNELTGKLLNLVLRARTAGISITVDAEEAERLEMSLDIFAAVFSNPQLQNWHGLGLAVQAYQKRAVPVILWLAALAKKYRRKIPLRLVKGAYWDSEIKHAQEQGLTNFPVYTHKAATDISYLACAKLILAEPVAFYPQFATHNAHTIAAVRELARQHPGYEFQRLHGMGERLYVEITERQNWGIPCRIYAPVGCYQNLLPYLVRRLLENGANTSFISKIDNPDIPIEKVISDPVSYWRKQEGLPQQQIPLPQDLYGKQRKNSRGLNFGDPELTADFQQNLDNLTDLVWQAYPLIDGESFAVVEHPVVNPFDNRLIVGNAAYPDNALVETAIESSHRAFPEWRHCPVEIRAEHLRKAADLLELNQLELVSICIREGGRTIPDAISEVREAVDFCRYYAASALELFDKPLKLSGPVGEQNLLYHYGRGVFVCISPWNFPIAIFVGQVTAALAAGNTVIAKPAGLTPLTAMLCVQILHRAGIPENVLQFLPGDGAAIGQCLFPDFRIAGVSFTGSTETAKKINRQLAAHHQTIVPLIAETGGQNVMITDSSALAEQVVQDAVKSAFNSAGQRCSALRVLFLQEEVAEKIIEMLIGAMQEFSIGNPGNYATDIGPVISHSAVHQLNRHVESMRDKAKVLYQMPLDENLKNGSFFPPTLIELTALSQLKQEVFGPVLHVIRYRSIDLDQVIEAVNNTGYGLTLGIHSRIESKIHHIRERVRVGNIYVNRDMIGAVVGVQPFGGMGLSGTGPKAGGPGYLPRFAIEQTLSTNTAAIGGNATLLAQNLR